jgi:hypothetical protein
MRNWTKLLAIALLSACIPPAYASTTPTSNSRLIILTDMGNEPDEVQQMGYVIMCSNEFELEGLIAVLGIYLRPESKDPYRRVLHPELFTEIIDAYAKVYKSSNPVVSDDGKYIAFQMAKLGDPAGVGRGLFLLDVQGMEAAKKQK